MKNIIEIDEYIALLESSPNKIQVSNNILEELKRNNIQTILQNSDVDKLEVLLRLIYKYLGIRDYLQGTEINQKEIQKHLIPQIIEDLLSLKTEIGKRFDSPLLNEHKEILYNSIDCVITNLYGNASVRMILDCYEEAIKQYDKLDNLDSEQKEEICNYFDKIRMIIGFQSTENILNDWLYGS